MPLPHLIGRTIIQKQGGCIGITLYNVMGGGKIKGDTLTNRIAITRIINGRLQNIGKRFLPMIAIELAPCVNRTRDGHGMRHGLGDLADALFLKPADISRQRRPSRAIKGDDILITSRRIETETIPAYTR